MSPSFDDHLEVALEDYNDKISKLEASGGTPEEFLDALVNRGSILSMMEYYVSAISDFDDAIGIIAELENEGKEVDPGSFIKAYVSRGELMSTENTNLIVEDYVTAASRLKKLNKNSKYFDERKIVMMCMNCSEDLVDCGFPGEAVPFIEKLYEILPGKTDNWSLNRYLETLNLDGQAMNDLSNQDQALEIFTQAIEIGAGLFDKGALEDTMSIIFPFISRGDIAQQKGLLEQYFLDRKAAISLLESLLEMNRLEDVQILAGLHQDVANTYLTLNKVKEAEEHLMREVMLNMDGAEEYIREYADREKLNK
jgi:hypothetical protein